MGMPDNQIYTVIGLMSGSSHDGVDAALIKTDGHEFITPVASVTIPYVRDVRDRIKAVLNPDPSRNPEVDKEITDVCERLTRTHIAAVYELLSKTGVKGSDIDLIGFHGHTIDHDPSKGLTTQIGDAALLANETDTPVVSDFRSADVEAGGQGAPLVPIYHSARAVKHDKPIAILNLGGVGNVTYLGEAGEILAFDTGPANALIDDWIYSKTGESFDEDGRYAQVGHVDEAILEKWMSNPFFTKGGPKSLDRNDFEDVKADLEGLTLENGAATLTQFTVASVTKAMDYLPKPPKAWYITGGGRKNTHLMMMLMENLDAECTPVETLGWNGDALEAECFGYLAVRRFLGLPISFPSTTGAPHPMTGGVVTEPDPSAQKQSA